VLNGLITRDRWVRLPRPRPSPGSSAEERGLHTTEAVGSIPARGTHGAVDEEEESPAFQAGHVAGSRPVRAAFLASPKWQGNGLLRRQVQVRALPPELPSPNRNTADARAGPRFDTAFGHGGSRMVVVVYRLCTRDCGPRGPGSTPGSHPKGARRRWRVGPACKAGAMAERVRIPRLPPHFLEHRTLVAQWTEHQVPSLKAASSSLAEGTHGRMSEWSGTGLQNRSRRFDSGCGFACHPLWTRAGGRWLLGRPS
jgi:hypothetical protein